MAWIPGKPTVGPFVDDNGDPAVNHTLEFFITGTSTPTNVAFDSAGVSTATSVTIGTDGLPENGGTDVVIHYDDGTTYDIVRKDSAGVAYGPTVVAYTVPSDTSGVQSVKVSAGSAPNVITADLSASPGSLNDQQQVVVELTHGANTIGNPTFNLNSLGAKEIVRDSNKPLRTRDTGGSGYKIQLNYSATIDKWVLLNPAKVVFGLGLNWWSGYQITNGTDTAHDIDIASGRILNSAANVGIETENGITKQIDANWAEGTNQGGFPSGLTLTADTWYRVFVMAKQDGTVDAGFDTASDASNLLADATDFVYYRRIGWVYVNASSDIKNWVLEDNRFYRFPHTLDYNGTGSTSGASVTVQAPPNKVAYINCNIATTAAAQRHLLITNLDETNSTPTATLSQVTVESDGTDTIYANGFVAVETNSSSQVRHRVSTTAADVNIKSYGWRDDLEDS